MEIRSIIDSLEFAGIIAILGAAVYYAANALKWSATSRIRYLYKVAQCEDGLGVVYVIEAIYVFCLRANWHGALWSLFNICIAYLWFTNAKNTHKRIVRIYENMNDHE